LNNCKRLLKWYSRSGSWLHSSNRGARFVLEYWRRCRKFQTLHRTPPTWKHTERTPAGGLSALWDRRYSSE